LEFEALFNPFFGIAQAAVNVFWARYELITLDLLLC